jgi:hypothetical protein
MMWRYSHLAPEQLQNAVKLLDGMFGERRESVGAVGVMNKKDEALEQKFFLSLSNHY